MRRLAASLALALIAAGCATAPKPGGGGADGPPARPIDASQTADAVPRHEARSRYGNPASYEVFGERYFVRASSAGFVERGLASWYGSKFHGRRTSSGEPYDMYAMTAAHKELPLPTYVEVTNLKNGRKAIVKVNDRGPFKKGRILDLSYAAADRLGVLADGTAPVEIRAITVGPTTATAQAVTTTTVPRGEIAYYIQAGAFADAGNADRLRSRISKTTPGVPVRVQTAESAAGTVHRVRLGPLATVADVDRTIASLSQSGVRDTQVVIVD